MRQYGNFSFMRIYEAGHEVPFYQPLASLAMFSRVLDNVDIATGEEVVTGSYVTNGTVNATHTEPYVAIPTVTGNSSEAFSFTAAITAPITSVPPEGDQVVATATASQSTTEVMHERYVRRRLDLKG